MKGTAHLLKTIAPASLSACVFFILLSSNTFAQERGKVEVVKDPKVDSLIEGYVVTSKANNTEPVSSDGFRVQIFSGSSRTDAYNIQAKFQEKYPGTRTYIGYREPDFKVKVGDFRSRMEAEKMMEELKRSFIGMFIVAEKINPPKLDTQ